MSELQALIVMMCSIISTVWIGFCMAILANIRDQLKKSLPHE